MSQWTARNVSERVRRVLSLQRDSLSPTSISELTVREIDPRNDPRWNSFVGTHPEALVYHHSDWLRALSREYGGRPVGLVCEDRYGQLQGVLPLFQTKGLVVGRRGELTGRRLSSLPRTPVAGPLALNVEATAAMLRAAVDKVCPDSGTRLQLKVQSAQLDGLVDGLVNVPWRLTYTLELPDRVEDLRFGNSRNHSRIRWAVNKATKAGVKVRPAESERELRAWYKLYLETMRWHAVPPRSYRFFQAMWELLTPSGLMQLMLAEHHGPGRSELLAGSIFLQFNQTVFYAFNGRRRDSLTLRPNDLLQWNTIHDACREGFRFFDFGEVAEDHEGLSEFKSKWGAEARRLHRYYYPASSRSNPRALEAGSYVSSLAAAAWRRVPLPLTAMLGKQVYRYL